MVRVIYDKETHAVVATVNGTEGETFFNELIYDSFECDELNLDDEIQARKLMCTEEPDKI